MFSYDDQSHGALCIERSVLVGQCGSLRGNAGGLLGDFPEITRPYTNGPKGLTPKFPAPGLDIAGAYRCAKWLTRPTAPPKGL